jgi:hypothetical protein
MTCGTFIKMNPGEPVVPHITSSTLNDVVEEDPGWFQPPLTIEPAPTLIEPTSTSEEVCGISDDS